MMANVNRFDDKIHGDPTSVSPPHGYHDIITGSPDKTLKRKHALIDHIEEHLHRLDVPEKKS
jgi:hypothetical protein